MHKGIVKSIPFLFLVLTSFDKPAKILSDYLGGNMAVGYNNLYTLKIRKSLKGIEKAIIFNEGVKEVPDSFIAHAFCDNNNGYEKALKEITEIYLPDSVEKIGNYAFCELEGLRKFRNSNNLKIIGKRAFKDVSKLSGFMIPSCITEIGDDFIARSSITKLYVDDQFMEELAFKIAIHPYVSIEILPLKRFFYDDSKYDYKRAVKEYEIAKLDLKELDEKYSKNPTDNQLKRKFDKARTECARLKSEMEDAQLKYYNSKIKNMEIWTEYRIAGTYNEEGLINGRKISRRTIMKEEKENKILVSELFNAESKRWRVLQKHQGKTKQLDEDIDRSDNSDTFDDDDGISI